LRPAEHHPHGGSTFYVTARHAPPLEFTLAMAADRPLARDQGEEVNHMTKLYIWALNLREEKGQTMAEYGVVLAVITLLIVGTLTALSGAINGTLSSVAGKL
jgi:Flp pilus assembly pilin Flp